MGVPREVHIMIRKINDKKHRTPPINSMIDIASKKGVPDFLKGANCQCQKKSNA